MRASLVVALGLAGCASVRPEVAALVEQVDEARLMGHVEALVAIGPRPGANAEATERTLAYLEGELALLGLACEREAFRAAYPVFLPSSTDPNTFAYVLTSEERPAANLIATLPGREPREGIVELCAHYDTVPQSSGADDNASGVAALLEVARVLADVPLERTLRLCFFGLEETGLDGSEHHARRVRESGERHRGALVLDMIGFVNRAPNSQATPLRIPILFDPPRTADFVVVAGSYASGWIGNRFESAARRYVPELRYFSANRTAELVSDGWRSDHASYWRAGLDAILLADTAEMRSPHYHTPSDLPGTLDPRFLGDVTRAIVATLAEWGRLVEEE